MINIYDQLDLRDLHYFEVIASLGHVGKAAEAVHRTQPALTGCIRRLESALETTLVEKDGRNIRLTSSGQLLLARSRKLLADAGDIVKEMQLHQNGEKGQIRIGVVPTAAHHILMPVTRLLTREFPNIQINTFIAQTDLLHVQLQNQELDLVVGLGASPSDEFESTPFFQDTMVIVASSSNPIFDKPVDIHQLHRYKWVLAPTTVHSRQWLEQAFIQYGLCPPSVQIQTNMLLMIPSMIVETELLSFISRRNLDSTSADQNKLKEVPIPELHMRRQFSVITRAGGFLAPAAQRLKDIFISEGRQLFETH